jgi:DNA-directed RNA polymerase subunit beta
MENHVTGKSKSQDVYLGDFPLMTKRGTFVINGVERVVVSQLMKSPGVFFTANSVRGRNFYGAKIIPNRGAWIEFDTDQQGVIGVKIDRKRRISATALLRMFGLARNEDITQAFTDIDTDANSNYIKATIDKDPTHTQEEGYIEIYKRIRPGDLATIDNAKQLLDAVFFQQERYDLSEVGRYKLNQRLGRDAKVTNRLLQLEDLVGTIREIIRLNNTQQPSDDIDHLANRRIRAVGELIQARMRVGLMRMARIGRDRMSLADPQTVAPAQLIHVRPIVAVIQEFFSSSQLSQFMDQTNPLAELEHKRRLSAMGPGGLSRERAGFEVRDVHRSHYGRLCPITTPEGPNIGLISHLATYARVNEYGFLETPYRKVESKNGRMRVTDDIEYLDAFEEEQVVIAQASTPVDENGYFLVDKVQVRVRGEPSVADVADIEYMDVSPKQIVSVTTSLIPFLEHNDSNRALMGSNMQRQAVPLIKPEAPLVGTGVEARAARDSGQMVIAETDGTVVSVAADEIVIQHSKGTKHSHPLQKFIRSNSSTSINQHPIVRKGQRVKKGDPIADGPAMDNGELALGQNLLVAFMSWEGGNYEDAILISERVVQQDRFSSIHIEDYHVDVRETKLGPEVVTRDIPNVGEEKLRNLDENGIVRIGAEVRAGDILVGKITPKGETELTPEERLLRVIFGEKARDVKDTSLLLPHGEYGKVVAIRDFSREQGDKLPAGVIKSYQISVAVTRKLQVGDKMAGRHGNKGVISKIVPVEDMPYLENGTPVDIILSPLGVASRMNLGQILETHLGMAAAQMQFRTASPALAGATEEEIKKELLQAQLSESGKVWVRDGKTGARFDEPVTVGCIYMMKLHHLVDDKMHARSTGPYSLITQQPLGGKAQFGGQRFGEMEVWALEGYGAAHTLQEMLTIKSDDVMGRSKTYESIVKGEAIKKPNIPESFKVLVKELQGLGLEVELIGEERTEASEEKAPEGKGEIAEKESESTEKVMLTEKTEA